jgi:hypothetical protein
MQREINCACGYELHQHLYNGKAVWCCGMDDFAAWVQRKPTRHDIYHRNGRRLRIGQCQRKEARPALVSSPNIITPDSARPNDDGRRPVEGDPAPPPKVITTARGYTRTIHARRVQWRCEWCSAEHDEWRYPGPVPRYCDGCKQAAQNSLAAGAIRRRRQAEQEQHPVRKRPVGRPRARY